MGQQQLLLLILSAIIVGVAIVMGINMFAENSVQANQDALMQDVLTLAARAQGWYRRPASMGGGDRTFDALDSPTAFTLLNFVSPNDNGRFTLVGAAQTLAITAVGREDGNADGDSLTISVTVSPDNVGTATITD